MSLTAFTTDQLEDVPTLTAHFVARFNQELRRQVRGVSPAAMEALQSYSWPGNIRELRNVIERSMILTDGPALRVVLPDGSHATPVVKELVTLEEVEHCYILDVLEQTGWRISGANGAARILAVKPTTLESRMKKLGIERKHLAARRRS